MAKKRLDAVLVEQGFFDTRSKAQAAIMAGQILVNDLKVDKPGTQVTDEVKIKIIGNKLPYVSRGGLKLEKALKVFPISLQDKTVVFKMVRIKFTQLMSATDNSPGVFATMNV